jgi:hypothetical protein
MEMMVMPMHSTYHLPNPSFQCPPMTCHPAVAAWSPLIQWITFQMMMFVACLQLHFTG